jgi:hypothetical protein
MAAGRSLHLLIFRGNRHLNIEEDIIQSHGKLSRCSVQFLDFIRSNPDSRKRANFNLPGMRDDPEKIQPWPTFINRKMREELKKANHEVCCLIKTLPQRLFANNAEAMARYYEIPREIVQYQLEGSNTQHLENLLARGDFILSPHGLKCLEFNITGHLGGWQAAYTESLLLNNSIISKFFHEYGVRTVNENIMTVLFRHIIEAVFSHFGANTAEINTLFAFMQKPRWREDSVMDKHLKNLYRSALTQKRSTLRGELQFGGYMEPKLKDGHLFYDGTKLHALIDLNHGRINHESFNAFLLNKLCLFNGPITYILANKLNLALLSEHENDDIFNKREQEIIKNFVPWTRKMAAGTTTYRSGKIELDQFVRDHKDKLVLKPGDSIAGQDVHIGKYTSNEDWLSLVKRALGERKWVVQEYLKSLPFLYQWGDNGYSRHNVVWGVFMFGPNYGGAFVRTLPQDNQKGIINTRQGAMRSVVFEVEESYKINHGKERG